MTKPRTHTAPRDHEWVRGLDDRSEAAARHAVAMRDKSNTVLVVEHKPETVAIADHVVDLDLDLGPARQGGGTYENNDM